MDVEGIAPWTMVITPTMTNLKCNALHKTCVFLLVHQALFHVQRVLWLENCTCMHFVGQNAFPSKMRIIMLEIGLIFID